MTEKQRYAAKLARAITGQRVYRKEALVVDLIVHGLSNSQIAITLGTTEQVIKNIVSLLFRKHKVNNRVQFAVKIVTQRFAEEKKNGATSSDGEAGRIRQARSAADSQ